MTRDHGRSQGAPSAGTALLDQAFDRDSLYARRTAVAAHAAEAGLSQQRVYDVASAAHELAANAVRHGAGHGLWMIDQLADKATLDRSADGTTVTMTFIISSPS